MIAWHRRPLCKWFASAILFHVSFTLHIYHHHKGEIYNYCPHDYEYESLSLPSYKRNITTLQSSMGKYKWKILLNICLEWEPIKLNMIFLTSDKSYRITFMELCVPCIWKISSILICYGFSLCLSVRLSLSLSLSLPPSLPPS
jgi:hypothetical protein